MLADGGADRRSAAGIGNVDSVDLGQGLEKIGGAEMRAAAGAGGGAVLGGALGWLVGIG